MKTAKRGLAACFEPIWRVSPGLCAFHDGERHLGHIEKTDRWHAFDATHLNLRQDGILYLGDFPDVEAAKAAVETSVASPRERLDLLTSPRQGHHLPGPQLNLRWIM
jgi:hypothetical protein